MLAKTIKGLFNFPSIAIAIISLLFATLIFERSENPYIFIFSLPRLLAIAGLGLLSIYLLLSILNSRLVLLNNVLILNIGLIILIVEVALRIFISDLPYSVSKLLPTHIRNQKLSEYGLMTTNTIQGEGLSYSYTSGLKLNKKPWVSIDTDGFRNSVIDQKLDIILLGDSVTIALEAKKDLGERLRNEGFSIRNFGFSGYSVGHYRDVYKRFVLDRKTPHKLVIINLCLCNDILDSRSHSMHLERGLTWREYLGHAPRVRGAKILSFSWALTATINMAYEVRELYLSSFRKYDPQALSLPKGKIIVPYPRASTFLIDDPAWKITDKYLSEISMGAARVGAKVILAVYPSLEGIYAPWFLDEGKQKRIYSQQVKKIFNISKRLGFTFIDYAPPLQKVVAYKNISAQHNDYHPNDLGVQVMMQTLKPTIQKFISRSLNNHNF